jgi:hypothetical protein
MLVERNRQSERGYVIVVPTLGGLAHTVMAPSRQNSWDPVLLISQVCLSFCHVNHSARRQIISMQTLHYLTLSLLVPPLLAIFAEPTSLMYEGGATNVGM